MAEYMVGFATAICNCLGEPTINQACYAFRFNSIVEDLRKKTENLKSTQLGVRCQVDEARRNTGEILENVQKWLTDIDNALGAVQRLEERIQVNKRCFCGQCPNWIWRYNLGKEAAKMSNIINDLRQNGNFSSISSRTNLPGVDLLTSKEFVPFDTTNAAFDQIMEALQDEEINVVGLYGMGGVGKTTLAKEVGKKVKEQKLFEQVVMAVVSQSPDVKKIQGQIAAFLGLKLEEEDELTRASRLALRLKSEKKVLIILDDVWKEVNLTDVGIPCGKSDNYCKILLTTRRRQLCYAMDCQRQIPLNVLSQAEAWALFRKSARLGDDHSPTLNIVAEEIAKECKGLPIAIVTLAGALRGKTISEWKQASRQLKEAGPVNIEDINEGNNAYACLKLSYDYLKSKETKLCFLLCSLFPEDHEIQVEILARCAIGLGLYPSFHSIEKVRNDVQAAVENLKASSLLLVTKREDHVKMHDLVRDFALWLTSEDCAMDGDFALWTTSKWENVFWVTSVGGSEEWPKNANLEGCKVVSISLIESEIKEFPSGLKCPMVEMFQLWKAEYSSLMMFSDEFFEEMKSLKVLTLEGAILSKLSLQFFTNLRVLELRYCKLDNISSLGMLKSIEILRIHNYLIKELPHEIGELNNLRLLDLRGSRAMRRIPSDLLRRLSQLEELYMGDSNAIEWDVEGTSVERKKASLSELNSLPHLATLSLSLKEKSVLKGFVFPKLSRFGINVGTGSTTDSYPTSRSLQISNIDVSLFNVFQELFPTVENLILEEAIGCQNFIPDMDQRGLNQMIFLAIDSCDEMECLLDATQQQGSTVVFSNLKELKVCSMNRLRAICDGQPPEGFLQKLEILVFRKCPYMSIIFPAKLMQRLQNLKEVKVLGCDKLQEVFQLEGILGVREEDMLLLSSLTTLELRDLPELECIWKGPNKFISLQSLKVVKVWECRRLLYLFPSSLAHSLVQLEELHIQNCRELEKIIVKDIEEIDEGGNTVIDFPSLRRLVLKDLPDFNSFFERDAYSTWPSLEELEVHRCPNFTAFSIEVDGMRMFTKKLQSVVLRNCSLFSSQFVPLLTHGLLNLERLEIENCEGVKELFQFEGYHANRGKDKLLLSSLKKLRLEVLSELRHIWKGPRNILSFQNLTVVEVIDCKRLKHIFSSAIASSLLQLNALVIKKCEELEQIIAEDEDQILSRDGLKPIISFPKLKKIMVVNCNKLRSLLPISIARGLPQLVGLYVRGNSQLEEVFGHEDEVISVEKEIVFPCLRNLSLRKLPSLTKFCPETYHLIFPKLSGSFQVNDCPKIRTKIFYDSERIGHAKEEAPQLEKDNQSTSIGVQNN